MKIEYNKILQLYQSTVCGCRVYGETVSECITQGIMRLNSVREYAGLSKLCQ